MTKNDLLVLIRIGVFLPMPALASVQIQSVTPSASAPQKIGTTINWTVTATDSNAGPLTFQFNVAPPGGTLAMVKDFNVGTSSAGTWTAQTFAWMPTQVEGIYQIQVVAKDFGSKETATTSVSYQVNPLVNGTTPVAAATRNPLVALFSAPACPKGSKMRVKFTKHNASSGTVTAWAACHSSKTMTFEIAGMYQSSAYTMFSQTETGGTIVDGPSVNFKTGALPTNSTFPKFVINVPPDSNTDNKQGMVLLDLTLPGQAYNYPEVATDLGGRIMWYYYPPSNEDLLARPLPDGILIIENGMAWNPGSQQWQMLRKIDWAGNIVKETNTGIIQQELLALGATDAQACNAIAKPAPLGSGCLDEFSHDFIDTLPNGYSAVIADTEKIFPAGTQGDTSGLPVDIIGNMIVVLDSNWQVVWYWDSFDPSGGGNGYPPLPVSRTAVLGETCAANQLGCPPGFLLGNGIAHLAHDWLHANSLYYWPAPQDNSTKGDLIWSSRHQDWVMRIDYKDGTGTGNILWRMGNQGDFNFNNINNDPWPWFSHQHEAGIENTGVLSVLDNGNTRFDDLSNCAPNDCNSRGMAVQFDESTKQVTPTLSVDLGEYASAMGSAQLLDNNNYFLGAGYASGGTADYAIEILPTPGTINGTQVFNMQGPTAYRVWRMTSLYTPPTT